MCRRRRRRRQTCRLGEGKINISDNTNAYREQKEAKEAYDFESKSHMAATTALSETSPGPYPPKIASSNPLQSCCEVEFAACECCGLTEECTPAYIARVRERFYGRWVCGLCGEAVKDELCRSERPIGMEEALEAHMTFCMQFKANPAVRLVGALRQLLRKSLSSSASPRGGLRSSPTNPPVVIVREDVGRPGLVRATSCFSTLGRSQEQKYE